MPSTTPSTLAEAATPAKPAITGVDGSVRLAHPPTVWISRTARFTGVELTIVPRSPPVPSVADHEAVHSRVIDPLNAYPPPVSFGIDGIVGVHAQPLFDEVVEPHNPHSITFGSPAAREPVTNLIVRGRSVTVADSPGIDAVADTGAIGCTPNHVSRLTINLSAGGAIDTTGSTINAVASSIAIAAKSRPLRTGTNTMSLVPSSHVFWYGLTSWPCTIIPSVDTTAPSATESMYSYVHFGFFPDDDDVVNPAFDDPELTLTDAP